MQEWRIADSRFDKNMTRPCEYGALDFFIEQTESSTSILTPELREKAFRSIGNDIKIPVINYDSEVTVSNERTCTIADAEDTSALYAVTFVTYQVGFTMVPTAYMNNEISYQHDFNRKMEKVMRALADKIDQAAVAALEAGKTQVFKDKLYYTVTGNDVQVPWDMRMEIFGDTNSLMRANCYPGGLHVIGNAGIESNIRKMAQHDIYNAVNKRNEFAGKIFHYTNNVTNESQKFATAFVVEEGNVGMLTRVDRESLVGGSALGHEWSVEYIPQLGFSVGLHYYTEVGNQSAIMGAATADPTCARKEHYGFSVDVGFVTAYNSAPSTVANPIIKLEIASPVGDVPTAKPVVIVNGESNPVLMKQTGA